MTFERALTAPPPPPVPPDLLEETTLLKNLQDIMQVRSLVSCNTSTQPIKFYHIVLSIMSTKLLFDPLRPGR